jgi:hypothetical protein
MCSFVGFSQAWPDQVNKLWHGLTENQVRDGTWLDSFSQEIWTLGLEEILKDIAVCNNK